MAHSKRCKPQWLLGLEFSGFYFLYTLIGSLSLKAGYRLGRILFSILFLLDARHRKRTIQHILHSGIAGNRAEAEKMARSSYEQFSRLLIEVVKARQLYVPERIAVTGDPEGGRFFLSRDGEPAPQMILITAHYGNWEIAGSAIAEKAGRAMTSMMRGFDNPYIGRLILQNRTGAMHTAVDKRLGLRPMLRAVAQKENLAILIDQHAGAGEGVECSFFGHPAKVHKTPALLHLKTGIPIVPEVTRRVPGDEFRFEVVCGAPITHVPTGDKQRDIQELTQKCISALESLIRREPEQWLWTPRHWIDINRGQSTASPDGITVRTPHPAMLKAR